mmetsp:Transcript_8482/g.11807  ORF Transcript_8482/g.11807 Transcript_8482/m.11807 type:complete len:610 (+) Transcript_8482:46-1875(+)
MWLRLLFSMASSVVIIQASNKLKPKTIAKCSAAERTKDAIDLALQHRPILIVIQTITPTKSNVCLGVRSDWREGLGQCLAKQTGLRVIVQNDDGMCTDCMTLQPTKCKEALAEPPALIIVVGGGDDPHKALRFHCTGTYCRRTGKSFVLGLGHFPPHDFQGACDVYPYDRRNHSIFDGRVAAFREPPTRIVWIPILNPQSEMRALWELSTLYANGVNIDKEPMPALPELPIRRKRRYPNPDTPGNSDYRYLKGVIEPRFEKAGRRRIDLIRDDAFPKPLLLPDTEKGIFKRAGTTHSHKRLPTLMYVANYRPTKGQVDFLQKLDPTVLGEYVIKLYGSRPFNESVNDDWNSISSIIKSRGLENHVKLNDIKSSHLGIINEMSLASGLIHLANGDRNPRVLYEALYFGLPIFVSIQSMPYIGLQCQRFVQLTDVNASAADLNAQLKKWIDFIRFNNIKNTDDNPNNGSTRRNLQASIRRYVDNQLSPQAVYRNLCQRFGLCAITNVNSDVRTPWASTKKCAHMHLRRYENWVRERWNASKKIRKPLNITIREQWDASKLIRKSLNMTDRNYEAQCLLMNQQDRQTDGRRPWWLPRYLESPPVDEHGWWSK